MKFAFISRHIPSHEQVEIARGQGIELVPIGDRDAFRCDLDSLPADVDGFVVVHAALAIRLINAGWPVAVFENANRAPEGAPPTFTPSALHIYQPATRRLDWRALVELAGGNTTSAERAGIVDWESVFCAILDGTILRVRGIGPRGWARMCRLLGLPEPVWKNGRLAETPRARLGQS